MLMKQLGIFTEEHQRDIKIGNLNYALFQHISQSNHNFDFNCAKALINIHNKRLRQIFDAGAISLCNSINTRLGFSINLSFYLDNLVIYFSLYMHIYTYM